MAEDPKLAVQAKQIVRAGYDAIADRYSAWAAGVRVDERARYTELLLGRVRPGGALLELGCGAGVPTTQALASRFCVTAVDLSPAQVARARRNVPAASVLEADMTALDFAPSSFDAVAAFYAIIHVPRAEHAALFCSIAGWLRPGGLFVASLGAWAADGVEPDWLGAPSYFSHFDATTNLRLLDEAGFAIEEANRETADEGGRPITFLWVVARKRPAASLDKRSLNDK